MHICISFFITLTRRQQQAKKGKLFRVGRTCYLGYPVWVCPSYNGLMMWTRHDAVVDLEHPPPPTTPLWWALWGCHPDDASQRMKSQLIIHGFFKQESVVGNFLRRCFDLNDPQSALSTLSRINPTLFLQNLTIRCLHDHKWYQNIISVYKFCQSSSCPSDNFTFPFVLKACSALNAVRNGKEIHCVIIRTGFDDNVVVQTALVDFYAKNGDIGIARKVHDEMPQPDLSIGKSLHGLVLKCGYFTNDFLNPAFISMYGSNEDLSIARGIFEFVSKKNVTMWNAMISVYTQSQKSHDAIELFRKMTCDCFEPDMVTFVSVIPSCWIIGSNDYGESLHAYVIKLGLQNQPAIATSILSMYAKFGHPDSAKFIFDQMTYRSLLSWNAMVSGYVYNECWNMSLAAIREMQADGVHPDAVSIINIVSACSGLEATRLGQSAHAQIKKENKVGMTSK